MFKLFCLLIFYLNGWKLINNSDGKIPKYVLLGAPHTSNWDLIFFMGGIYNMNLPLKFIIKKEWLKIFPLNKILLSAGAISVDRESKSQTMVNKMAETINNSKEDIALLIAPEGSRKHVRKWKTGFYYTALLAEVPIIIAHLDYAKKEVVFGFTFLPSGNYKEDMGIVKNYFKNVTPKYPENFCLDIYQDDENIAASSEVAV
mgnify:CR=1 FL=1